MITLGVNDTNDIFLGPDGNLVVARDILAVLQTCAHAAKAQLGEEIYAIDQGVPNFETVWQSSTNVPQFSAYLRRALEQVEGVIEVTQLDVTTQGNVLSYVATIRTIYGEVPLNG